MERRSRLVREGWFCEKCFVRWSLGDCQVGLVEGGELGFWAGIGEGCEKPAKSREGENRLERRTRANGAWASPNLPLGPPIYYT